jgi:hypothetical protein
MFWFAGASATVAALALAFGVASTPAAGGERSGVEGEVIDTTCLGPCSVNGDSRPYAGEATIVAEPRSRRARAADGAVDDGDFRVRLRPGRYRVEVRIDDPCWQGDSDKLRVHRQEFRQLRFEVSNDCIR